MATLRNQQVSEGSGSNKLLTTGTLGANSPELSSAQHVTDHDGIELASTGDVAAVAAVAGEDVSATAESDDA